MVVVLLYMVVVTVVVLVIVLHIVSHDSRHCGRGCCGSGHYFNGHCTDEISSSDVNSHKTSLANIYMCLKMYCYKCAC